VTAVAEETPATPTADDTSPNVLAPWHVRAGAFVIDALPGVAVVAAMALTALTVALHSTWWWACVSVGGVAILLMAANRALLPAVTGFSVGRALCGITVTRCDGVNAGPGRLLLRDLAHLLDTVSVLVGWLWPVWDARRRTFADLLLRTEVRRIEADRRPHNTARLTGIVVSTATLLCVGAAALSYATVYLTDWTFDRARAQIAKQGPPIVAQMLTYDPKSLDDDFKRAQSLTTDRYRGQLRAQQETVRGGHPVANEYWVTNSSVLSAVRGQATMLLFMQGRRGPAPGERFITATVRVRFVKGADASWRVDDLTVLAKPTGEGGK
jgi:Mce-associated membrane protein